MPVSVAGGHTWGILRGSGAPNFSAKKGCLYIRTDPSSDSERVYINTDGASAWSSVIGGASLPTVAAGKETASDSVTNTESNVLEVGPITVTGSNRVRIVAYCEVVKDTGTTSRLATLRLRRDTNATITSADTLVAESRVQLIGVANAPANVAISVVDTPGAGTYYYALLGQNGNFAITYEDKALVVEEIGAAP